MRLKVVGTKGKFWTDDRKDREDPRTGDGAYLREDGRTSSINYP